MDEISLNQEYKVGELSKIISGKKRKKGKDSTVSSKEKKRLASLFNTSKKPTPVKTSLTPVSDNSEPKKNRKRKLVSAEITEEKGQTSEPIPENNIGYNPPEGIVHESLLKTKKPGKKAKKPKTEEEEESDEKDTEVPKHTKRRERDKTKDSRTVFVGNLPVDMDKKQLKKLFRKFGEIENVRFRCPPPANLKLPKKVIAIKKDFHPERTNMIGFVCFKEEESTKAALKLNGKKVDGHHLQVDLATNEKKHDHKCSVFVGNLPYDITEDAVWEHFEDCGRVKNVHIIRDNRTGIGKGFCYVTFSSRDAVSFALKLNDSELSGRNVRVLASQENPVKTTTDVDKKGRTLNTKKKFKVKPSNQQQGTFQGLKSDTLMKGKKSKGKNMRKKLLRKKTKVFSSKDQSAGQRKKNYQNAMTRLEGKKHKRNKV